MGQIDRGKLWSVGFLHMGQSFPGALAAVALPAVFRQNGLPLEMFWLFALPLIPSWLRWLIALLVDNVGSESYGFRKSWIVPCTLVGAAVYLVIGTIEPGLETIWLIIGLLILKSIIMTAQDVAIDGLAVESFAEQERPLGSAIIVFLMFMGTVAAQGMVAGVDHFGWQAMLTCAALLLVAVAIPTFIRRESAPPAAAALRRQQGRSASITEFLRRAETRLILPVLVVVGFSSNMMRAMLPVFLVDLGLSLTEIGLVFGIAVIVGSALAAITIPKLTRRFGTRKLTGWVVMGYLPCLLLFDAFNSSRPSLALVSIGMAYVMYVSTAMWMLVMQARMAWSAQEQAATDFSAQASVANLGEWLGATVAGFLVAALGWTWFFHIGWGIAATSGIAFLVIINPVNRLIGERT